MSKAKNGPSGAKPPRQNPHGPDQWKLYDKNTERSPKTPVVVFSGQLGAFARAMKQSTEFHISAPICTHMLPPFNYRKGEMIMHTTGASKKVLSHLRLYHEKSLLQSLTLPYKNGSDTCRPVCEILKMISIIEKVIAKNLLTNLDRHASNAASVREAIYDALREKFSGSTEVKSSIAAAVVERYRDCLANQARELKDLSISHGNVVGEPGNESLIHTFVTKHFVASDDADRTALSALRMEQEKTAIQTAIMCIGELGSVYDDIRTQLETDPWTALKAVLISAVNVKRSTPEDPSYWWSAETVNSSEKPVEKSGEGGTSGAGTGGDAADVVEAGSRKDFELGEECLGMFLWDLISERLELLWSNLESFLNIFLSGNKEAAGTLTGELMEKFIPICLSPLFKLEPMSSSVVLANQTMVDPVSSDTQTSIRVYYGRLYSQLSERTGGSFIAECFNAFKPCAYTDDSVSRTPLKNAADAFVKNTLARKSNDNHPSNISYRGVNYDTLIGAIASLDTRFGTIDKIVVGNVSKIPSSYKIGSVLKERDNSMADWIRKAIIPENLSDDVRYEVVRKVIMSVYSSDPVFSYLYRTSLEARELIAVHAFQYAAVFYKVHSNPLSKGVLDTQMTAAEGIFSGQAATVVPVKEEGEDENAFKARRAAQLAQNAAGEKTIAPYKPRKVAYVVKYIASLTDGNESQFNRTHFRNPKYKTGESERAIKTLMFKKVTEFQASTYRQRPPNPTVPKSRPTSAVSNASAGGKKRAEKAGDVTDASAGPRTKAAEIKQRGKKQQTGALMKPKRKPVVRDRP